MATETSTFETVKEQADKLLAGLELPPEIQSISTDIGEDNSGDTALFIHLHLAKEVGTKESDIRTLTDFTKRVQILLLGSGIAYFPYVSLDEAA
jgi:hypothetical protein